MKARKGVLISHSLPSRVAAAHIVAEVAGIDPLDHVAVLELVAAAPIVGKPVIDLVHPTGSVTNVKLIEIIDSFDIGGIVDRRVLKFHVDLLLFAGAL